MPCTVRDGFGADPSKAAVLKSKVALQIELDSHYNSGYDKCGTDSGLQTSRFDARLYVLLVLTLQSVLIITLKATNLALD